MSLETLVREHVVAGLPPRALYDVVTDYACYPRVFPEFIGVRVVDTVGPLSRVEFRAKLVVEVRYVLAITHDRERLRTAWSFIEGDVVSDSEGGWEFFSHDSGTLLRYRAGMAVSFAWAPLPKLVVNKVSNALMGTSVPNMFRALEREALARRKYAQG